MIELIDVCAGYDGKEILHKIKMSLEPGKVTVIIGPNGCGKSTLLKSLVRFNPHTAGKIQVQGKDIFEYSQQELAKQIAYLPQSRNVPDITVLRMVLHGRFPYLNYPRRYRQEDIRKAKEALEWVGIPHLAEQNVNKLSGGNQQKVYIAMALAQDTPVILMDEPTTYLDISHQIRVMELVKELAQQGKAIVLVLHDLEMALQTADYLAVLSEGNLIKYGTAENVFASKVIDQTFGIELCRTMTEHGWRYYYGYKK